MNGDFGKRIKEIIIKFNEKLKLNEHNRYKENSEFNAEFDAQLGTMISQIKSDVIQCAKTAKGIDIEEFERLLEVKLKKVLLINGNTDRFQKVRSSVNMYIRNFNLITNEIKQVVKHDYASKRRFLLFRVLTTLGIAGAALSMAMFAHWLGYETAILKKIDEKPKTELATKPPINTTVKDIKKVITAVKSG